ncbi:MAG: hypothetical protein KGL35_13710, partial [Bradyrhizobium sp.]|nr:hypothetical protein [Bradyrhizobium sp.]
IGALQLRGIGQWTQVTGQMENPEAAWQCHQMQDGRLVPFEPPIGSRRHRRGKLHAEMPTRLFGPVRNDIDQLIGHADASLGKVDNATNWMADILADAAKGKVALHVALELEPKPGFSAWLESR